MDFQGFHSVVQDILAETSCSMHRLLSIHLENLMKRQHFGKHAPVSQGAPTWMQPKCSVD